MGKIDAAEHRVSHGARLAGPPGAAAAAPSVRADRLEGAACRGPAAGPAGHDLGGLRPPAAGAARGVSPPPRRPPSPTPEGTWQQALHDGDDVALHKRLAALERPAALLAVNKVEGQRTALMWAAEHGHVDLVGTLLRFGANPLLTAWDASLQQAVDPVFLAAYGGHVEVLRLLVAHGCDHRDALPALRFRVHRPVLDYLVPFEDSYAQLSEAAFVAAISDDVEGLAALLDVVPYMTLKDRRRITPELPASPYGNRASDDPPDPNDTEKDRRTMLSAAIEHGASGAVHLLLERFGNTRDGPRARVQEEEQWNYLCGEEYPSCPLASALYLAVRHDRVDFAAALAAHGTKVAFVHLLAAARAGQVGMLACLLRNVGDDGHRCPATPGEIAVGQLSMIAEEAQTAGYAEAALLLRSRAAVVQREQELAEVEAAAAEAAEAAAAAAAASAAARSRGCLFWRRRRDPPVEVPAAKAPQEDARLDTLREALARNMERCAALGREAPRCGRDGVIKPLQREADGRALVVFKRGA